MKKFISLVLASVMLLSLLASGVTVSASDAPSVGTVDESYSAEGTPITDAAGFAAMEADGKYYLANDITIDATWNAGNEVSSTYANNAAFTGSLDGNGKTITTSAPLFANLCGTVKNLTVEGTLAESELHAANITMWTNGTVTVDNVYTKADIPLGNTSGGIIGYAATGATITITNCRNDADILCTGQVGGMVGYVQDYTLIIENCINNGNLYSTNYGAGIVGRFGRDSASPLDSVCIITGCVNNGEVIGSQGQTAGILGFLCGNAVISDCINTGSITNYSGAAGGIFGTHANKSNQCGLTIKNCENYGYIQGITYTGGIAARVGRNISHADFSYRTENCSNYGLVQVLIPKDFSSTVYVGGIVAYAYGKKATLSNGVINCINIGTVEVTSYSNNCNIYVAGILGYVNALTYEVKNNINVGAINITGATTVAALTAYNKNAEASDVYNNYSVASGNIAAGYFGDPLSLTLNPDVYVITSEQLASGEVAYLINEAAGETIYYQKIGEDSIPVLTPAEDGSNTVYKQNDGSFGNTLPASLNGDVNGDGRVDIRDAAAIMLFISGKPVECMSEVIDTNGDGEIDLKDAENILKNITAHVDAELKKSNLCEHKLTLVPAIEATCTTKGNIEYYSCSECSMLFKDNKASVLITYAAVEVPVSHIPGEWVITVPPTDTEDGVNTQYCSICGATIATDILYYSSLGLEYTLKDDQKSYSVSGIGTCIDTEIIIAPSYNGLPVTGIGYNAFADCLAITSISIPNSITSIGNYAFNGCSGLKEIVIPDSITTIGSYGFGGCSALTDIVIPDSVINIGSYAFSGCESLKSITLPNNIKTLSPSMFNYCVALTAITIPDSVTSIGNNVFYNCSSLTSITIPNSVTSIGEYVFYNCSGLTTIAIPDSVASIGRYAFWYCTNLTSLTLPSGITTINPGLFADCHNLTSVTIPDSVTSIGRFAFMYCESLTSITLPNGITTISHGMLAGCKNLTSIIIPNGVTSIENEAFSGCSGLISITIPNSVTIIDANAFWFCSGLTSITIPYGVTIIGDRAFDSCSGLTSITVPSSVKSIGADVFQSCSSLEHFIFRGTEEAFNAIDKDINWNVDANFTVTFDPPFEIYEGPADDFKFTAQSVIGNVSYDTYTDFNAIAEKSFLVPALAEKMVPQGMDVWEERGWLLISGYFADSADFDSSVLLAIDMNTGAYVGEYYLTNAYGTPHTSHAGGVAVTEKNVYISNGSKLYCIPLTEIIDAGQCGKITISEEISVPVAASFCNYSGGYLWVGDFQYGSSYTTEEFRHMINREGNEYLAWIVGYKLTDATESGIKAESMVNGSYATPDVVLSITNRIQGMTVSGNSIILSQSYGRTNDSTLYVFENPIGTQAHTETTLNGVTVPVYFLDGKLSCNKITALPMSEGIAYSDGKLYVLFESGADKYANDGGKTPTENVWTIEMD